MDKIAYARIRRAAQPQIAGRKAAKAFLSLDELIDYVVGVDHNEPEAEVASEPAVTFPYLLPLDGAEATLIDIVNRMPSFRRIGHEVTGYICIQIADDTAAVYARCRFGSESPFATVSGESLLEPGEIIINEDQKAEAEDMFAHECPSPTTWGRIVLITVPTAVQAEFLRAYHEVLPHGLHPARAAEHVRE